MKIVSAALFLALFILTALSSPEEQQTPTPLTELPVGAAVVSELKGQVTFQSPQAQSVPPQIGLILPADSTIETAKGSVLLTLQEGSQLLIKGHTRVVLRAPNEAKGFYLELLLGKIIAKVQKRLGSNPSFRMGTPTAVITVRGTRFSVEVTKKQRTYVEVFEGVVEVMGIGFENRRVLLRPGYSTGVQENREPDEPRQFNEPGDQTEGERPGTQSPGERENQQPRTGPPTGQTGERPD
jgi:hypothetical protein